MFLSRMALDLTRPNTQLLLHSKEAAKEMVQSLFPKDCTSFLWTHEHLDGRLWLFLSSTLRPDYGPLHEKIGFLGVFPSWDIMDYSDFLEQLEENTVYHFRLHVYTFDSLQTMDNSLIHISRIREWFLETGKESGFLPLTFSTILSHWESINYTYVVSSSLEGTLKIINMDHFQKALIHGFGYHKDYGSGLMTISTYKSIWH